MLSGTRHRPERLRHALERARQHSQLVAARIVVRGATRANAQVRRDLERFVSEVRAAAIDGMGDAVWIEKVRVETCGAVDIATIREEAGAVGHLARRLAAIKDDPKELAELAAMFAELDKRLPSELREGDSPLSLGDHATLRALVEDAEAALLPRLLEPEDG